HALDYYGKYRERELRAMQLETRLAQAELDALRMQLHPHFLFNTLNSISVLMTEDVRAARRMLTRLSDLLRKSLANKGAHESSLKGIGLSNTQARLEQLYGSEHRFELHNRDEGGLSVMIAIPFRSEASADGGEEERDG